MGQRSQSTWDVDRDLTRIIKAQIWRHRLSSVVVWLHCPTIMKEALDATKPSTLEGENVKSSSFVLTQK